MKSILKIVKYVLIMIAIFASGLLIRPLVGWVIALFGFVLSGFDTIEPIEQIFLWLYDLFTTEESTPKVIVSSIITGSAFISIMIAKIKYPDSSSSSYQSSSTTTTSSTNLSSAEFYEKQMWDHYKRNFKFYDSKGY